MSVVPGDRGIVEALELASVVVPLERHQGKERHGIPGSHLTRSVTAKAIPQAEPTHIPAVSIFYAARADTDWVSLMKYPAIGFASIIPVDHR